MRRIWLPDLCAFPPREARPGTNDVLFTIQTATQVNYDEARIALLSLETGKWRTLFDGGSYARFVPSGHIVYAHAGALMAVPFDQARLQVKGSPVPVRQSLGRRFRRARFGSSSGHRTM